jgi:hypothetical protein
MRVGDPALALLKPDVRLDADAERLLRADFLRALPDPTTEWDSPNGHLWIRRALGWMLFITALASLNFFIEKRSRRMFS